MSAEAEAAGGGAGAAEDGGEGAASPSPSAPSPSAQSPSEQLPSSPSAQSPSAQSPSAQSPSAQSPSPAPPEGSISVAAASDEAALAAVRAETEERRAAVSSLEHENALLQAYIDRVAPHAAGSVEEVGEGGRTGELLSVEQKAEIVVAEVEALRETRAALDASRTRAEDALGALLEEEDLRIAGSKKNTYEFKRDVVLGGENSRTGKIESEKVLRFLEDGLRLKDARAEKLRGKNKTLKSQIAKSEAQLHKKEEQGEMLHVIDFDQLKIENQQYLERIEERNNELLRLKLTTGKTALALNSLKGKLAALASQDTRLSRETKEREGQLRKFESDIERVNKDIRAAERTNRALRAEQADPEVPTIMDYISVKAEAEDLEKKITDLDRKVEITTMTARRVRNATRTLGMHNTSSVASPGGRSLTGSRRGTSGLGAYTLRSP